LDADDAKYNIIAYNSNEFDLVFAEKNSLEIKERYEKAAQAIAKSNL